MHDDPVLQAARAFDLPSPVVNIVPYGKGLIHATYLLRLQEPPSKLILQRINTHAFPRPQAIMANLRLLLANADPDCGLQLPAVYRTKEGKDFHVDANGGSWRILGFIKHDHVLDRLQDVKQATQVGLALGRFHKLTQSLDAARLAVTRPRFHDTPFYLQRFYIAWQRARPKPTAELRFCQEFIAARAADVGVLEEARRKGGLAHGVIHGDPKLDNFLFDDADGRVVSLIDLDTVQPGLLLYDLGDCLRSACNTCGETPQNGDTAHFDMDICRAVLKGYAHAAGGCLSSRDRALLFAAIRLIPFELGLRFITDYIGGNSYFRIDFPDHNLVRALTQFQLVASIEAQEGPIAAAVADIWAAVPAAQ